MNKIRPIQFIIILYILSGPLHAANNITDSSIVMLNQWTFSRDSLNSPDIWQPFTGFSQADHEKIIWIKTSLPQWSGLDPALYTSRVNFPIKIYQNNKVVFQFGRFLKNGPSIQRNHLLVPIESFKKGDEIVFEILVRNSPVNVSTKVFLVPLLKMYNESFVRDLGSIVIGSIFMTIGIVIIILVLFYKKPILLWGIAIYLLSLVFFIISNTPFLQMILPAPKFYYHTDYISLICATIGAFWAIEQTIAIKFQKILNYIWKTHLIVLIIFILVLTLTRYTYREIVHFFLILLTVNMIICITVMLKSAKEGLFTARILFAGMSLFLLSAILEIYLFYRVDSANVYIYSIKVLHFGALFFVISLLWIAYYHYIDTFRQKEIAQEKELQAVKTANEASDQFAMRLIESQENERNRIALELHDSVGQKLLIIKNLLLAELRKVTHDNKANRLQQVCDLSGETIQDVRNITYNLRPRHLDQLGLTTAIETIIENFAESAEIRFQTSINDIDGLIPKEDEINFFRIIQESLNNIVKHSRAADAFITIKTKDSRIHTEIRDNGVGTEKDFADSHNNTVGLGITGMYERARMIGADLNINFPENGGTMLTLIYHIKRDHA